MNCPACGAPAIDGARFCAACGEPLQRRSDERRVVTVLFADLVGYTSMAEARDPEHVKNLVDRCFQRLRADIEAFGGRVDKIVGDAILALFGAPIAHEDDAERAVRAGLAMQRTLDEWATTADERALRLRIGINTGEVLVGALRAGGDYTAMGDVVNTASRLQTSAKPGQVLVGPATVAATRQVVRYTPLGPLVVKGREEPVEVCIAEEALLPPGARPNRGRAPLVGRDSELGLLAHTIDAAVTRRRAGLLLLIGEAGMGKTRLAEEAAEAAKCRHDTIILEGRCVPYGEANVWWPVAEALRAGCDITASDPIEVARERCMETVKAALGSSAGTEAERVTNGLLHLMGYEGPLREIDPTRAREEMVRSLFTFVESATRQRPMIVVLSDLHWADDIVLERMDQLLERVANHPFVLIATARHALLERWTPQPGRHNSVVFNLDPLDRKASSALLSALAEGDLPDDLRQVLLDRSGGNPFYLEELVSLLSEVGMVGAPSATGRAELPDTLRGLVAARLDGLTPDERRALDDASVMGRRGAIEALEIMAREAHGVPDITRAISGLAAKDLLVIDDGRWSFRSDLVREVAYGMLTKADRVRRHYGIAKWMEMHHLEGAADVDRIAHHYAVAATLVGDIGPVDHMQEHAGSGKALESVDLVERADHWLRRAVEQSESGELHMVTAQLASQALDLGDEVPHESRLFFLLARARASIQLRDLEAAHDDLAAAMQCADTEAGRARVLLVQGDLEQKIGDLLASVNSLQAAIDAFRALGDDQGTADGLRALGMTLMFEDENVAAESAFSDALELYKSSGDRRGEAWALQNLAWLAFSQGRADRADAWLQESAATFQEIGDSGGLGWALGLLAWVRYHQGRYLEAETLGERILEESRQRGDRWAVGMMLVLVASLRVWTGRAAEALDPAQEACDLFGSMGDWYGHGNALGTLGRAYAAAGMVEEAFRTLDDLVRLTPAGHPNEWAVLIRPVIAAQVGLPERVPRLDLDDVESRGEPGQIGFTDALVALGLLDLQRGQVDEAVEALATVRTSMASFSPHAGSAYALALAAAGRPSDALDVVQVVLEAETGTYADTTVALEARGLAYAQQGDAGAARQAFDDAHTIVDATDDVLMRALVKLAEASALHVLGDDRAATVAAAADGELDALGLSDTAWRVAFTTAAAGAAAATA